MMMEQKRQKVETIGKATEQETKKLKRKLEIASKYNMRAKKLLRDLGGSA